MCWTLFIVIEKKKKNETILLFRTLRYFVATDQNGSPLAVFDASGNAVKEITRTPFGALRKDTHPDMYIPVDFHGGILDPHTRLIYLDRKWYDPSVGQWITPDWERLSSRLSYPTDIFIYRFQNNDPISSSSAQNIDYMTGTNAFPMCKTEINIVVCYE